MAARTVAGSTARREASANSATSAVAGTTGQDDGGSADSSEGAFADIIEQIAAAATPQSGAPARTVTPTASRATFLGFQATEPVSTPGSAAADEALQASPPPNKGGKKEPVILSIGLPARSGSSDAPILAGNRQPDLSVPVIQVLAPPPPPKPRLTELASGGAAQQAQLRPQSAALASTEPEAALTLVIRSDNQVPAISEDPTAQGTVASGIATSAQLTTPEPIAPAVEPAQLLPIAAVAASSVSPVAGIELERKKVATGALGDASVDSSGADTLRAPIVQAGAFQDLQLKAEPAKAGVSTTPREDAPRATPTAQEPPADKTSAQPLKSLSLEFTPDGARDVRVRLAERGGEVHVSLHSSDPAITKNLRDGVTDLAGVLAQAGYDAKAWTSSRQQQNPQQREEPAKEPLRAGSATGAESFDGLLQQGEPR